MATPIALLLGTCLGAGLSAVVWLIARRPSAPDPNDLLETPAPRVPEGVERVLGVLRSSTVVVGPHDEVLHASPHARSFGLVRGTRVHPEVLELVRDVRGTDVVLAHELEQRRGRTAPPMLLAVRVAAIDDDLVLVLGEDRTAAARVEATRRDFTTNVSHELKTPIGAVALLAEALEDAADDPEAVRRFAGRMRTEAHRLSDLVSSIIQLSRLQADDPLLAASTVDVDDMIERALDGSRVDAERKDVTLTRAGNTEYRVMGDPDQLTIALSNLVANAVAYSDPGARVVVAASRRREDDLDLIEISVSDNGIGIDEAELERIFERFYRVDYARSRANGGTGLGLSIVKHVALAHGGTIGVWSKLGHGSTFTLKIPEKHAENREDPTTDVAQPQEV